MSRLFTKTSLFAVSVALWLGVVCSLSVARAEEPRVEVGADQVATVIGNFDSLEELLSNLCVKGNATLRAYDAPDRPVMAHLEDLPLRNVLERLMAQENYVLGVRRSDSVEGEIEVAWIRVTGRKGDPKEDLPAVATDGAPSVEESPDRDSENARAAIADRLLGNETQVAIFLATEPSALAQSLRQYPDIDVLLRKLRTEQAHPAVIEKIDAVLLELTKLQAAARP